MTEFTSLKLRYHNILHLMPNEYEITVGKLQNYLSDDQICAILISNNFSDANKIILGCLVERMNQKEELLDFCDQLENISGSHDLYKIISEIRSGKWLL